jgi:hypothetical protein
MAMLLRGSVADAFLAGLIEVFGCDDYVLVHQTERAAGPATAAHTPGGLARDHREGVLLNSYFGSISVLTSPRST